MSILKCIKNGFEGKPSIWDPEYTTHQNGWFVFDDCKLDRRKDVITPWIKDVGKAVLTRGQKQMLFCRFNGQFLAATGWIFEDLEDAVKFNLEPNGLGLLKVDENVSVAFYSFQNDKEAVEMGIWKSRLINGSHYPYVASDGTIQLKKK